MEERDIPRITGTLRAKSLQIPEVIWQTKGIVIMGRRIKSVVFTTDIAIIRNCNADAVLAVYPFTPQQIISDTIINASSVPVLVGVGGGTTKGFRSAIIAKDAEAQGAFGVVVNSPMSNDNIALIKKVIDIPIIATVVNGSTDIDKPDDFLHELVDHGRGQLGKIRVLLCQLQKLLGPVGVLRKGRHLRFHFRDGCCQRFLLRLISVSYTHLDVYKRQPSESVQSSAASPEFHRL